MERPNADGVRAGGISGRPRHAVAARAEALRFYAGTEVSALISSPSRQQNRRTRGAASLEIGVRLADIRQRETLVDAGLDLARHQYVEQFRGHRLVVAAFGDIGKQRRACEKERASSGEFRRI